MLAPYLVGTLLLVAVPALASAALAFTAYDALSPPVFVGFDAFRAVAADPLAWIALGNSLVFVVLAVPIRLAGALGLALLLHRPRRGVGACRTAVYLPTVIPDVAYALIFLWLFNPLHGPVNLLLGRLGLPAPAWLADEGTARYPFVAMAALQVGEGFIVLLAALRGIPRDYYDAASVDGAGAFTLFRWLTLPLLVPWLLLLTFRDIILSFQYTFVPAYVDGRRSVLRHALPPAARLRGGLRSLPLRAGIGAHAPHVRGQRRAHRAALPPRPVTPRGDRCVGRGPRCGHGGRRCAGGCMGGRATSLATGCPWRWLPSSCCRSSGW
jgi:multiple sugar transport system permease protein